MDRPLRYHPLFDCDVREAAGWYDRRSPGLGDAFVETVRQAVNNIIADPKRYAMSDAGLRYVRTPRFPYVVLFEILGKELAFLGVTAHGKVYEKMARTAKRRRQITIKALTSRSRSRRGGTVSRA